MYNYLRTVYHLVNMTRRAYWDQDRLKRFQDEEVRRVIGHAYSKVPFYHETLDRLKLKPSDVKTVGDLNKLPVLRKEDVRNNLERMVSVTCDITKLRRISTSGSTGKPLSIFISQREDEIRKVGHLRANISCGQKPRDNWVVVTPPAHHDEVPRLLRTLGVYAFTPLSVFDEPGKQIEKMEELKADVLEGYSTSLLIMAKEVEKRSIRISKKKFLVGGAEVTEKSSRQFIEKTFDAPFYDQYSSTEFGRMAWQCSRKTQYHIDADLIAMQIIDKEGSEVAPGESGEIVCTSLFSYAMPLIRYSLGDIGVLSDENDCPCGRKFPFMKVIEGRKDSILVLPNGREVPPLVIGDGMMFFKYFDHIDQYRVVQKQRDLLKIQAKLKASRVSQGVVAAEFEAHLRRLLKVSKSQLTIKVEFVDDIALDRTGKLMKVISEL